MVWLFVLLAIFNIASMYAVFSPRIIPRNAVPWGLFITSLLAIELAWLWLPVQICLTLIFVDLGATDTLTGQLALWLLALSWTGLLWCLWKSTQTSAAVSNALNDALGFGFERSIPAARQALLRDAVHFTDWARPLHFKHPNVEVIHNIPYAAGGIRQQLDIYRPRNIPPKGCPVLLQIHGGAWVIGDKTHQALPLMTLLASRGWICVAANYRLSPSVGFPTHLEDCKSALCWIREHGKDYGMNPDFVAVTGGSAGGHLAALMGLTENRADLQKAHPDTDTSIQACIPFYGVYDLMVRYNQHPNRETYQAFIHNRVIHSSVTEDPQLWQLASPISHIHDNAPPFLTIHGDRDSLAVVSEGRIFHKKLAETSRNPAIYMELPGAEHAFDTVHSLRTEHVINGIHRFLEWTFQQHQLNNNADE